MPEKEIAAIAENARIIVSGYAFTRRADGLVSILNLGHPDCAMVVDMEGNLIETNMDPIEQRIVMELCRRNLQFMEDEDA
ncbi:MAG: hypothetical protein E7337_09005 [Clostridiales bacterium]|nr:hypothetical protein [Clostridiales bacterium]